MHDQMCIGYASVDFSNTIDGQNIACRWSAKFIGAMAGATGDSESIYAGFGDEICRFFWVGEHLVVGQHAVCANAVFFPSGAGFEGAEAAQLTFDGNTTGMGHIDGALGDINVVLIARGCFTVFL